MIGYDPSDGDYSAVTVYQWREPREWWKRAWDAFVRWLARRFR